MWYFGYTDYGSSSTTNPAFEWIKYNIYAGGRAYSDVSAGTGIYPSFSDYINMTVRYDWTDGTGHDYYKIVYYDTTSGSVISITNLWVDSRGCSNYFQSEGFNLQNVLKGKIDSGQYRDTSYSWHDWSGYTLTQAQGGQEFCVQAVSGSNNAFRFGTYISGVCTTP